MSVVISLLWVVAVTLIKISISNLYITIFHVAWFRRMAYVTMIICVIYSLAYAVDLFLLCRPFVFNRNNSISSVCGDHMLDSTVTGVILLCLDLMMLSMPMPLLWCLQIAVKKKMALCSIFIFGFGFGSVFHTLSASPHCYNLNSIIPCSRIYILCSIRLKFMLAIDKADITYTVADFGL